MCWFDRTAGEDRSEYAGWHRDLSASFKQVGASIVNTSRALPRKSRRARHLGECGFRWLVYYIIDELRKSGVIGEINSYKAGQRLASKHVNHYVTDGEVMAASLMVKV